MNFLRHELQLRNSDLYNRALHLIGQSNILTPYAIASFPSGTDHGPDHTSTIEKIGDVVLTVQLISALNDFELHFLLLAYYFHDLGMVGREFQFNTPEGREQVRREHSVAVGARIVEKWAELGFANEHEAQVLADICRGHRPDKDESGKATWESLERHAIVGPGSHVRLRVLAALIYAIDELHIGDDRADERVRRWIEIKTEESQRHWKRHQMIHGPTLIDEQITFTICPRTAFSEDDLRRNVLAKAFNAYRDLKRELVDASITFSLPDVAIRWTRTDVWKLMVIDSERTAEGATKPVIEDDVFRRFMTARSGFLQLDNLCLEYGDSESELRKSIAIAIRDFETTAILVRPSVSDDVHLATSSNAWTTISDLLRRADEIDRLLGGTYRTSHRFSFYREGYGKRFVADYLGPLIVNSYGVDVRPGKADEFDASIGQILRTSPTAAQLVGEVNPFHSDLVKRRLLCLATITGFTRDVLENPELILNADTRKAIYFISEILRHFERSYEFFEELALLSGLTEKQIAEVLVHSQDWQTEMAQERNDSITQNITLTQSLKTDQYRPSTAFSYLLLAGQRSGAPIQLRCNYGSSITLTPPDGVQGTGAVVLPVSIGIAPGEPQMLPRVDFRCQLSLDTVGKQVTVLAFPLNDLTSREKPFRVRLPSPAYAKEGQSKVQFSLCLSCITVGDVQDIGELAILFQSSGSVELQLTLGQTGERFVTLNLEEGSPFEFSLPFDPAFIRRLAQIDRTLPYPWFCPHRYQKDILSADVESASQLLETIKEQLRESREEVPTFTLVIETEQEVPFREEFLRFSPGISLLPPTIEPGGKYSQQEIDQMWNDRTGVFKLETHLREDTHEVAESFRKWARDPSVGFPVSIDSSQPTFHQTKTVHAFELHPRIDRVWYVEAPIVIRLRPTTRMEQLETELKYWKSRNDVPRCQLITEKMERLRNKDRKKQEDTR